MSFLITRYYAISPTPTLIDVAKQHQLEDLLDTLTVWRMQVHTHHMKEAERELLDATWVAFIGDWDIEAATAQGAQIKEFLRACLELGPDRCWEIRLADEGGDATELFANAEQRAELLATNIRLLRE